MHKLYIPLLMHVVLGVMFSASYHARSQAYTQSQCIITDYTSCIVSSRLLASSVVAPQPVTNLSLAATDRCFALKRNVFCRRIDT